MLHEAMLGFWITVYFDVRVDGGSGFDGRDLDHRRLTVLFPKMEAERAGNASALIKMLADQRAMEDGEYDLAATEKNSVEEKQRKARRDRDARGEEFVPRWFSKGRCDITGEEYWGLNHEYGKVRNEVAEKQIDGQ